ncbi:MAG: archease [Thermoplasmata archaeon]|nr:MAG: archease [Thermoplasmata archaeon]
MGRFEHFEHTADIGVRAYGETLDEAFIFAAKGMFEVVTDINSIEPIGEVEIKVEAADLEELLTRWLSELLLLLELEKLLMVEFDVCIDEKACKLTGRARGEVYKPDKHEYKTEIKAVTQHILEVTPIDEKNSDEKYKVQVLLDI